MSLKDIALQDIDQDFKSYAELTIKQLNELETIVQCESPSDIKESIQNIESGEEKMDQFEALISKKITSTIVLHHPVASELRKLMAYYRIIINMERIGDLVYDISGFIQEIEDSKIYGDLSDFIFNMVTSSSNMVEKALLSFINEDRDSAIWTIKNDEAIDKMNKKLMKKGIKKTKVGDDARAMLLNLINFKSVISKIERIGDHASHIAEASIFALEGKDIRHNDIKELS